MAIVEKTVSMKFTPGDLPSAEEVETVIKQNRIDPVRWAIVAVQGDMLIVNATGTAL